MHRLTLDSRQTHRSYTSCLLHEENRRLTYSCYVLHSSSTSDTDLDLIIYQSPISSKLTYNLQAQIFAEKTHMNKIQIYPMKF